MAAAAMLLFLAVPVWAQASGQGSSPARDLFVTVGKSLVVESPLDIQRVSVADGELAEAVPVDPKQVLINGKTPGETSLILWQQGGNRLMFDLKVQPNTSKLEAVREELRKELPNSEVTINFDNGNVYLRGTVPDVVAADRAEEIAKTLGKTVNLLRVEVPPMDEQILLKVRFANVDRSATQELGVNIFSTGAGNTIGSVTTQQFSPPRVDTASNSGSAAVVTLTDALNLLLFRPDLNIGATLRALQQKKLLQILAEPNLLAINGQPASFLAGGEFPIPVLQSGVGGAGAITIQWREFGIRTNFIPQITPRGTIRLKVNPEVSSLDLANGITISGFQIPAISTRRVSTEIELQDGQSFAIAGLLDNRVIETMSKIPGLGDIPLLGKLFQSRALAKNNTELLVVVTPEIVRPIPADKAAPEIAMPQPWLKGAPAVAPRTPGIQETGRVPVTPPQKSVPVETLKPKEEAPATPQFPVLQLVPMQGVSGQQGAPAAANGAQTSARPGTGK
jgi:pilus assembly protein CpaC